MIMLLQELIEIAKKGALPPVKEIRVGLFYTGVLLEDGRAGVAGTLRDVTTPKRDSHDLRSLSTGEILDGALSPNPLLSSIGLATLNALLEPPESSQPGDILDYLDVTPVDRVGMVGYFGPIIKKIRDKVKKLYIFERIIKIEGLLPDWAAPVVLPECDIVIVTGTAFINKTIDGIIEASKNARRIAILGPSTPMAESLLEHVQLLSGVKIKDPVKMLNIVSQGGGTKALMSAVLKINLKR